MNSNCDILQIISLLLGYQNLIENRQQTADNNVQSANDKQTKLLLKELHDKFEEQNKTIQAILEEVRKLKGGD